MTLKTLDHPYLFDTIEENIKKPFILYSRDYPEIEDFTFNWLNNVTICLQRLKDATNEDVPFVYLSTIDLYGNNHYWSDNTEEREDLYTGTNYLLTKRAMEKHVLSYHKGIVIRGKNFFDNVIDDRNYLLKLKNHNPEKLSNQIDCYTYVPDMRRLLKFLLENEQYGLYNCVQTETVSENYIYKDLLKMNFDGKEEISGMFNDVNSSKVSNLIKLTPLEEALSLSWADLC